MAMGVCPSCGVVCNLIMTTSTRIVRIRNEKAKRIMTRAFHCERCFQFVCSEDEEELAPVILQDV
ncbi:MAG: hypothetical protein EHM26_06740 [Desulfobacteraceae bacterium]|jgi:hypothetical protein|nr:MAG: hypothetical protein EHM26_06740 [Desulfobacteraceae bacterium]